MGGLSPLDEHRVDKRSTNHDDDSREDDPNTEAYDEAPDRRRQTHNRAVVQPLVPAPHEVDEHPNHTADDETLEELHGILPTLLSCGRLERQIAGLGLDDQIDASADNTDHESGSDEAEDDNLKHGRRGPEGVVDPEPPGEHQRLDHDHDQQDNESGLEKLHGTPPFRLLSDRNEPTLFYYSSNTLVVVMSSSSKCHNRYPKSENENR